MKLLIMSILLLVVSLNAKTELNEDLRLCKIFQDKKVSYEKTLRTDIYAKKTLESYEKKIKYYCK